MMLSTIKAELRKLFTIRSTYVILGLCLIITVFFSFYLNGLRLDAGSALNGRLLANQIPMITNFLVILFTLVGIFLVSHEYRYNTILYTLTSARSRLQVFVAKFLVVTVFTLIATIVFAVLSAAFSYIGTKFAGLDLVSQSIPFTSVIGRTLLFSWGFVMLAMVATFIIRSQIGAIAFIFFFPGTIEALIGLLLKDGAIYLPFVALNGVLRGGADATQTLIISLVYIVVGAIVAAGLFWKRDAN